MPGSSTIQSLQRALDILETVARSENGARLNEIAHHLSLKKTTAHNLVRTLCLRGYLEKDTTRRYRPGSAFEDIFRQRSRRGIIRRAETQMKRLYASAGGRTITFSELLGNEICCRLRMSPEFRGVLQHPQSQILSAFGSASGLCLQVFNPSFRDAMSLPRAFDESGQNRWSSWQAFERAVAETAENGLAIIPSKPDWHLAAPVGENHVLGLKLAMRAKDRKKVSSELIQSAALIASDKTERNASFQG